MYNYRPPYENELMHYGVLGQKWGVRRYQNPDGTLTAEGKKRYYTDNGELTESGKKGFKSVAENEVYALTEALDAKIPSLISDGFAFPGTKKF